MNATTTATAVERLRANGLDDIADILMNVMAQQTAIVAFQRPEDELIETLCASLYPGAKPESARLVLNYCRAANLDPMQKPVHIVPMKVKVGVKKRDDGSEYNDYQQRDTIMPGIGLYRTQAARTGQYAGQDKPVYGPMQTLSYKAKITEWKDNGRGGRKAVDHWDDAVLEYPEWCEVTVYKLVAGVRYAFTGQEYWLENYATVGNAGAPNEMWARRTRGQLKKCAEAQALRMAFPEAVGAQPTAEEMEGRTFDMDDMPEQPAEKKSPKRIDPAPAPVTTATAPPEPPTAGPDDIPADDVPLPTDGMPPEPPPEGEVRKPAAAAPAPKPDAATPAPAPASTEGDTGELATDGECKFLIRYAERKGAVMRQALDAIGLQKIPADTLRNITKVQWAKLKGSL